MATAFGVSEWTQMVSARTRTSLPPSERVRFSRMARRQRAHRLRWIDLLVFAGNHQLAVVAIIQIGVVLGQKDVSPLLVDRFVERSDHAEDRHVEDVGSVTDCVRRFLASCCHAIEGAVRFDVVELHALGVEERLECSDLVDQTVCQFLTPYLHLAAAETLEVGKRRVGADLDAVVFSQADRSAHMVEIGRVESAGDIGRRDEGHHRRVVAQSVNTEAFAHVTIDECHRVMLPASATAGRS